MKTIGVRNKLIGFNMGGNMKLHIKNVSKISSADIDIDGITVIAGSNNAGKSTIGKTLYAMFQSFYNLDDFVKGWKPRDAKTALKVNGDNLNIICKRLSGCKRSKISYAAVLQDRYSRPIAECKNEEAIYEAVKSYCVEHLNLYNLDGRYEVACNKDVLQWIDTASTDISDKMLNYDTTFAERQGIEMVFRSVFHSQMQKAEKKEKKEIQERQSSVTLEVKGHENKVIYEKEKVKEVEQEFAINTRALYIDNPRVMDNFSFIGYGDINNCKKRIEEYLTPEDRINYWDRGMSMSTIDAFPILNFNMASETKDEESNVEMQQMDSIIETIDSELKRLMEGTLIFGQGQSPMEFMDDYYKGTFKLQNLSTGVKAIALLQTLLHYRVLKQKSVLILDEPEINLHPEWQVAYAKYIVMLQKELELHVVITTHSPFFLKAIENATKENEGWKKCHYYYAYTEDGDARIENKDYDMDSVYSKMMMPLLDMLNDMPI